MVVIIACLASWVVGILFFGADLNIAALDNPLITAVATLLSFYIPALLGVILSRLLGKILPTRWQACKTENLSGFLYDGNYGVYVVEEHKRDGTLRYLFRMADGSLGPKLTEFPHPLNPSVTITEESDACVGELRVLEEGAMRTWVNHLVILSTEQKYSFRIPLGGLYVKEAS